VSNVSILGFAISQLSPVIPGKTVIEVGSQGEGGRLRKLLAPFGAASYTGIDIFPGDGVDVVCDVNDAPGRIPPADVVVSTEMLEHVENWRGAVRSMKALTRPGGWLLVTTRSEGFRRHCWPSDHWRFSVSDFQRIFADFDHGRILPDPMEPGVFFCGRKEPGAPEADLDAVRPVPAPDHFDSSDWKGMTVRYLVRGIPHAARTLQPREAVRLIMADYPHRFLQLAGIWRRPQ
jgi:SAM-dependent methyltransferase